MQFARQRHLFRIVRSAGRCDCRANSALVANDEIETASRRGIRQFGHAARPTFRGAKINISAIWTRRVRLALRLTVMVEPSDFDLFHG